MSIPGREIVRNILILTDKEGREKSKMYRGRKQGLVLKAGLV